MKIRLSYIKKSTQFEVLVVFGSLGSFHDSPHDAGDRDDGCYTGFSGIQLLEESGCNNRRHVRLVSDGW